MKPICLRYYLGETMLALTNEPQATYPVVGDVVNFFIGPKQEEVVVRITERVWFFSPTVGKPHHLTLFCVSVRLPKARPRAKPRRKH